MTLPVGERNCSGKFIPSPIGTAIFSYLCLDYQHEQVFLILCGCQNCNNRIKQRSKYCKYLSITYVDLTVCTTVYYFMSYALYHKLTPRTAGHFPNTGDFYHQWTFKICSKSWLPLTGLFPMTSWIFCSEEFSSWSKHLATGRARVPMTCQGVVNAGFGPLFLF